MPAEPGSGRVFFSAGVAVPAKVQNVVDCTRCTTLGANGARISTVEHLLAALAGCYVDNCRIEVDGPEIPIMDGSALPFLEAIVSAGICGQGESSQYITVSNPILVESENRRSAISAHPSETLSISVETQFDNWPQGDSSNTLEFRAATPEIFTTELAPARTFAFYAEVAPLLAAGLAKGGSLDNVVIISPPDSFSCDLRLPGEWWRHKLLDLIGDLALVDARIQGNINAVRPGHAINTRMAAALAATFD